MGLVWFASWGCSLTENHTAIKDNIRGLEDVRSISLKDQERFKTPWAVEMVDEEKFERTVSLVGRLLRDDLQLQALYHMLVMMCPSDKDSQKIQVGNQYVKTALNFTKLCSHAISKS